LKVSSPFLFGFIPGKGKKLSEKLARLKNLCKTFYIFAESRYWITRSVIPVAEQERVMTDGG